jgi:OOP family OmpA-OmpF porin
MKRIKLFVIAVILTSISLFSGNASAQIEPGTFSLTPNVGFYGFDNKQDIDNGPIYGIGFAYDYTKKIGVEAVFNYVNTDKEFNDDTVEAYLARVDGLFHFMPDNELVPYIAAGLGTISVKESSSTDTNGMYNAGAGIKYFLSKTFAFRADARYIRDFEDDYNNVAVTAGFSYFFGKAEPAPAPAPAPAPMDSDGDGVYDDVDQCPGTPKGATVDNVGCPKDSDGDGVYDGIDQCPNTPKGATVDNVGCPKDSDGDGVYDGIDQCPNTPNGAIVDNVGCPKDSDGDGVYDGIDQCPDTPAGLKVDATGCPLPIKETVSIDLSVQFDFDSAVVKPGYDEHINRVAKFLKSYPEVKAVIEGHTCNIGTEEYNMKLSQRRAKSVMQKLIDKGVDASRMQSVGFGESRPIADNSTKSGRERNRRVMGAISTVVIKLQ